MVPGPSASTAKERHVIGGRAGPAACPGISAQLRSVNIAVVLVCILGAQFPKSWLIPFRNAVEASRTVQAASEATRWLFLGCGCLWAGLLVASHQIGVVVAAAVRSIAEWSTQALWLLVCGLALGLRLSLYVLTPPLVLRTDSLWQSSRCFGSLRGCCRSSIIDRIGFPDRRSASGYSLPARNDSIRFGTPCRGAVDHPTQTGPPLSLGNRRRPGVVSGSLIVG